MIGCECAVCRSNDPRDRRLRPSGLLKIGGKTILIDSGPDFRQQALTHHINHLDGMILTHTHYDHIAGLDELRIYYVQTKEHLPVLLSRPSMDDLQKRYHYLFGVKSFGVSLTAQLEYQVLEDERGETEFLGVPLQYMTYSQGGMAVNGLRFGSFAYVSDIQEYPETIYDDLQGVETLVLSALRERESLMHLHFDSAVEFARRVGAKRTFFTHMNHEVCYGKTTLPEGFELAYDGLELEFS